MRGSTGAQSARIKKRAKREDQKRKKREDQKARKTRGSKARETRGSKSAGNVRIKKRTKREDQKAHDARIKKHAKGKVHCSSDAMAKSTAYRLERALKRSGLDDELANLKS
eukprot:6189414-Pleurochrysis_carterae.AAC.2